MRTIVNEAARERALGRYRFFFRTAVSVFVLGLALTLFGVFDMVVSSTGTMFGAGLLLVSLAGLQGYKTVLSTMKILDMEPREHGWRSVG
jgi:hypothetical protein